MFCGKKSEDPGTDDDERFQKNASLIGPAGIRNEKPCGFEGDRVKSGDQEQREKNNGAGERGDVENRKNRVVVDRRFLGNIINS